MAILQNGIETVELGATAWRVIYNSNFEKLYTKTEVDQKLSFKANASGDSQKPFSCASLSLSGTLHFSSTNTTAGSLLPEQPAGFLKISLDGVEKRVPFYD